MAFESLSHWYDIKLADFPHEWLPLTFLYDADLPLFPIQYFHMLDPNRVPGQRPGARDRLFGYIHHINLVDGGAVATVAINKNLGLAANALYIPVLTEVVRDRLGLGSPIRLGDIQNTLTAPLASANQLLDELWHKIVVPAFGNMLPFGQVWDAVFGLARFIASWNSDGGRKGELIQTHYFCASFGERIASGDQVNADFYLLPTFEELQDKSNPLHLFPAFAALVRGADLFSQAYCEPITVGFHTFSAFRMSQAGRTGKLNTAAIQALIGQCGGPTTALTDCYNAFNRGPQRTVIALLMLHDLRQQHWSPQTLTPAECGEMYAALSGTYQTPKVIQLYAQQCFGQKAALPLDIWVETFLRWPTGLDYKKNAVGLATLFSASPVWGQIERLIWVAVQARKVHSSVCADILWCIRYGGPDKTMRGANPLSCKICDAAIRAVCPAYAAIAQSPVTFNGLAGAQGFQVTTSAQSSTVPNQTFTVCVGQGVHDEYSPRDRSASFRPFPQPGATSDISVADFISRY